MVRQSQGNSVASFSCGLFTFKWGVRFKFSVENILWTQFPLASISQVYLMGWYTFSFNKEGSLTVVYCISGLLGTSTNTTVPPAKDSSLSLHNRAGAVDTAHSYCSAYAAGLRKIITSILFGLRGLILSLPGVGTWGVAYYAPQAQLLGAGGKSGETKGCGWAGRWLTLLLKLVREGTGEKLWPSTKGRTFPG